MSTSQKFGASQKGLAPILIVLILALALLGGYLVYQNPAKPTTPPQPSPTPSPTTTPDPTANWKTYISTQYGFEVKYPSDQDFEVFERPKENTILIGLPESEADYAFYIYDNLMKLSLNEWLRKTNYGLPIIRDSQGEIRLSEKDVIFTKRRVVNQEAIEVNISEDNPLYKEFGSYNSVIVFLSPDQNRIFKTLGPYNRLKTVLSTFKFTQ